VNDSESETLDETTPLDPPKFEPVKRARGPYKKRAKREETTDGPNVRTVEAAWQGMWVLMRIIARIFGFECDAPNLPTDEAKEDAAALLPVVERHPTIGRVLSWIGAPIVILQRVTQHFRRRSRDSSSAPSSKTGSGSSGESAPTATRPESIRPLSSIGKA
jgi:hypothetical protein